MITVEWRSNATWGWKSADGRFHINNDNGNGGWWLWSRGKRISGDLYDGRFSRVQLAKQKAAELAFRDE